MEKDDINECYPLGGMIEPYDIEREKELMRDVEENKTICPICGDEINEFEDCETCDGRKMD